MNISLCSVTYNPNDGEFLKAKNQGFDYLARRLTRTATLDGGCVITDNGFSAADGTISLALSYSENSNAALSRVMALIEFTGDVTLASPHGFFYCALQKIDNSDNELSLTLLITRKV